MRAYWITRHRGNFSLIGVRMRIGKTRAWTRRPATGKSLSLWERIRRLEDAGLLEREPHRDRPVPSPLPMEKGLAQKWLQEETRRMNPHAAALYWDSSAVISVLFQDQLSKKAGRWAARSGVQFLSTLAWADVHAPIAKV